MTMRHNFIIGLISVLSAITIYLPDEVASFTRCPEHGTTNVPTISYHPDEKFCNVYHQCNCTLTQCQVVESHVCPIAKVYSKTKATCLDIEEEGCDSTYVQWVQTHSSNADNDNRQVAIMVSDSLLPSTSTKDFECEQGQPGKFSDPNICNIFHVCITRNEKTVDQPFMCPYPTVFKSGSSGKMFCARPEPNDCRGKAFYRTMEDASNLARNIDTDNDDVTSYRLPANTLMIERCTQPGLYPDSLYCNAYHQCTNNGEDQQYLCENQLLFNPESNICDYPINVVCGGKGLLRRPAGFSNGTLVNSSYIMVYGSELRPDCPSDVSNVLVPDMNYCNVFYHCQAGRGSVYMCREGTVFDSTNQEGVSSCRLEELIDCGNRLILTSQGKRPSTYIKKEKTFTNLNLFGLDTNQPRDKNMFLNKNLHPRYSNFILLPPPMQNQKVVVNVPFDCKGRIDGHWRDTRYCDVFHACIAGEQKRSYGCNQIGERFYFDDASQKCEFASRNLNGCQSNQYYTAIEPIPAVPGAQLATEAPTEPWKIFIQSREQFSCTGKQDGFYASRWCNVFYRCYTGIASAFLCPKMPSGARLWWVQHGSPQGVAQETAQCTWPCETGRRCSSSGGIIVDSGSTVSENQQEAESVFSQSLCTSSSSSSSSGSYNPGQGAGVAGTGSNGQQSISPSGPGTTSGQAGNVDGSFYVDSDVSCISQADGVFLGSRYCNVFHRCVSGTRRDFRCPRATNTPYDLWWNQQTQQCDWPCRIPCSGTVFGTATTAQQVRTENALLFSNECAGYQSAVNTNINTGIFNSQAMVYSSLPQEPEPARSAMSKLIENPDPNFICTQPGKFPTRRYCNVYYECSDAGLPPTQTFECIDSFFDRSQGLCMPKDQVPCLGGIYPYDSVPIDRNPDSLQCSTNSGFQLHTSRQFCNIYYLCDGTQTTPTTFRCFDRQTQQEGIYDPFAERCDSRRNSNCQNSILNLSQTQLYRSISIDHTRLPDLSTLPCKYDQQYVIEHEQYCNLYHVCKQGDYHLYACISNGEDNQPTSYFYQPNGQCAAPLSTLCPKTKSVFSYGRLLATANSEIFQPFIMPGQQQQQHNYGSMPIQERVEPIPKCRSNDNYIISHERYCNLFYGCKEGELILYACVDRSTNVYGGIFQRSTGNCVAPEGNSKECPNNEFYRPTVAATTRMYPNVAFRSYTMLETSNETSASLHERKFNETNEIKTTFSCVNRVDGYYESEWCNIFYRCVAGKRINERCPSAASQPLANYDLWWRHQSPIYNASNPQYFGGLDYLVRCEWPCKVECKKTIWISSDKTNGVADQVLKQDQELRPGCSLVVNRKIEQTVSPPQKMVMYSDIPNPTNFTCPLNLQGVKTRFADPKYCNVFHECINSKLILSYLCIESQFDSKEKDCVPFPAMNTCPEERRYSYSRSRFAAHTTPSAYFEAVEVRSVNPSGYECITDGIHTDPMFCNLFHACSGRTRRTFQCRQTGTDGINEGVSTFDLNTKSCTRFSTYSCPTLLYNQEFVILPVMFIPPTVSPCGNEGFFPVSDVTAQYCNMFAWCSKGHGEPKVFECVPSVPGAHPGAFDISRRSCTSRVTCPRARHSSPYNTSALAMTLRPKIISIGKRKQFSLTSTMLENGYIALGVDFQTSFTCPLGTTGFYANPNYCDVFHYCYETGELASFICASMPNRYQLWWSHQNEPGRPDNVFCDWPCNLQGAYACPAHKSNLMRDRQPVGNVAQQEVIEATCSSAQVPTVGVIVSGITPDPVGILTPTFFPAPSQNVNNIPPSPQPSIPSSVLGYQPCAPSNEWYVSSPTIRCSTSFAATGFAPDPKDCSKYYACDAYVGPDGMSSGMLMQCLAGLWWDQQRRTCVLPSEVACNPYNIINSQGQNLFVDNNPTVIYQPLPPVVPFPSVDTTPVVVYPPQQPPQPPAQVVPAGSTGPPCRGGPLCIDVGLNILQQMKGIPGRPGWFYKCDSQCALEMRCPPGLVFDDVYQRCEWPGAGSQSVNQRLGSLRDKKPDDTKSTTKSKVKKLRVMSTTSASTTTATTSKQMNVTATTVSSKNQTAKLVEP
ncbi:unnamed protein product [Adineta ricciae]|uniref:Chitin-binding type-2 domain-containing protein n=1 Tax=Adineta ricciae TaxID=249248 RepID=A0A814PQ59_ADIRI|nr:unnamed protein product [Adineta ricciae]